MGLFGSSFLASLFQVEKLTNRHGSDVPSSSILLRPPVSNFSSLSMTSAYLFKTEEDKKWAVVILKNTCSGDFSFSLVCGVLNFLYVLIQPQPHLSSPSSKVIKSNDQLLRKRSVLLNKLFLHCMSFFCNKIRLNCSHQNLVIMLFKENFIMFNYFHQDLGKKILFNGLMSILTT